MAKQVDNQMEQILARLAALEEQNNQLKQDKEQLQARLLSGKKVNPLDDADYRAKCRTIKTELERLCIDKGVTLAHVFTIPEKDGDTWKHPVTGETYMGRGKAPGWFAKATDQDKAAWKVPLTNGAAH